jgi:hypothetical protein
MLRAVAEAPVETATRDRAAGHAATSPAIYCRSDAGPGLWEVLLILGADRRPPARSTD